MQPRRGAACSSMCGIVQQPMHTLRTALGFQTGSNLWANTRRVDKECVSTREAGTAQLTSIRSVHVKRLPLKTRYADPLKCRTQAPGQGRTGQGGRSNAHQSGGSSADGSDGAEWIEQCIKCIVFVPAFLDLAVLQPRKTINAQPGFVVGRDISI